ncbi:MAG: UDP-N-acetylmuramate--L-alanine ligase [Streptosporangiaceae bacterium]
MTLVDDVPLVPADRLGRVHLVGVGGAGMSGIARVLAARRITVSGCDAADSEALEELRALGATVTVGHDPAHVDGCDTVVVSSAVRGTNPEVAEARGRGRLVLPRGAALASLMAGRRGIAVAGTHGKTTTTSLLTLGLRNAGADPSYVIGGALGAAGPGAGHGRGEVFVAEADESDGSFLLLRPHIAVITNVEADHLDNYGTVEAVHQAFERFVERVDPVGCLVVCADDPGARALADTARASGRDVRTYGISADADVRADGIELRELGSAFDLVRRGRTEGRVRLALPGRHNIVNAAGAMAVGLGLGFGFDVLRDGVADFTGARRRFELKGEGGGVRVFDSYAHHPTEVAADLEVARRAAGKGRVVACFQPHLYSRTRFFARDFGRVLALADDVVVMDVYPAREDPEPGVSGALVAEALQLAAEHVSYEPAWPAVAKAVADRARRGDLVVTIGAGDVTRIGPQVLALLRGEEGTVPA